MRSLLIDNYDSYTYNLFQQLSVINNCEVRVVRNDITWDELVRLDFDNIIISPGPGHPGVASDFGVCREVLLRAEVPVLGVCLGHQGIAMAYGGRVGAGNEIVHGRRSPIFHDAGALFAGVEQGFLAVRYHSLVVVPPVPADLRVSAWTADGTIMALEATHRPIFGVQFHPESCMTDEGTRILANFRDITLDRATSAAASPSMDLRGVQSNGQAPQPTIGGPQRIRVLRQRCAAAAVDAELLFHTLRKRDAVWLDSACPGVDTGRFSFIALGEGSLGHVVRYDVRTGICRVKKDGVTRSFARSIFEHLTVAQAEWALEAPADLPFAFCGGYVGWFGYECKADCAIPAVHAAPSDDAAFLFADRVIAIDHATQDVFLLALTSGTEEDEAEAEAWFGAMHLVIVSLAGKRSQAPALLPEAAVQARPARDKDAYLQDIRRCQDRLRAGESYQVCLTNQFTVDSPVDAYDAYRHLRRVNPAPYAAYLDFGDTQVACASPERFMRVSADGTVEVKPMKGTAPRDADPGRDADLARALAADPKERAENLMIVDLLRSDLGRVCALGSVHVTSLMAVESFEKVHQMVSTVRGKLRAGATAVDCVRACFPGGSMTGAPKLRACSIIDELETSARGIYSGAIGYFSVTGAAEFNVVIRTLVYHRGRITLGAGGGITILSNADREWEEVVLKARSVLNALGAELALC